MKHWIFLLAALFSMAINGLTAQEFHGLRAEKLVHGSDIVRIGARSSTPEFIHLRANRQFAAAKFPLWAKKVFKLGEGLTLKSVSQTVGKLGQDHIKYQVFEDEVPVFGAYCTVHVLNDLVVSVSCKLPDQVNPVAAIFSEKEALQSALHHVGATSYKWESEAEEAHLRWETGDDRSTYFPKGELVYINPDFDFTETGAFHLAYMFDIYAQKPLYRAQVFVDAVSGQVLFENQRIHVADANGTAQTGYNGSRNIVTDSFSGGYRLREAGRGNGIRTYDMNTGTNYGNAVDFTDADNVWNNVNGNLDQYAADAHWGAEMTYDYYLNEHGRHGIDGNDMQILSYVHYDVGYFNAFWDGQRMSYGDGDGLPLTTLDICGHEMTHGVTDFTAALVYQDESGALNESFSDVFGASIEWVTTPASGDWLMGEDVGTLRSMSNPNAYGDPDTYNGTNWYTGTNDNGGVHTNSGVQNKWYFILTDGESGTNDLGNSYNVTGIGIDDASAIAYRSLTVYLGPSSDYADARFYSIQAAADLFGGCSQQVISCTDAWYAVGVGDVFNPTVSSDFQASVVSSCHSSLDVDFSNLSSNGGVYFWDFGDGSTSSSVNPTHAYSGYGSYTVTLMADGGSCGSDTLIRPNYINLDQNSPCIALMPTNGVGTTQTSCTGTLYDDGGPNSNYMDDIDVSITIAPPGASSVTVNFNSFAFEAGYDYLYVYDGNSTNSPLLGQYDGFTLPSGGSITSSGGAITIRQFSDTYVNEAGFDLNWECVQPNAPPTPDFTGSPQISCSGEVSFTDLSINGTTGWLWDFGDGSTSTLQNPAHVFAGEGLYSVTLTATNNFGSNVVTLHNYITVDRPAGPMATGDQRCDAGTLSLSASGGGQLSWYGQAAGGVTLGSGNTFNTPSLSTTTSYFVEETTPPVTSHVGPVDNSAGGGGNFTGDQYLIFNCLSAFTLKTVKVYAQGGAERTIELRDANGTVLQSTTVYIANGGQTVTLNYVIQPGNSYQLGTTPGPDLYRNSSGLSFPYTVADVVSITTSSAGIDYYYFFYDWVIETPGCTTSRTEVVAQVAEAPVAQDGSRCGPGTLDLVATAQGDLGWYDAATGGSVLGSGSVFTTPSLTSTSSYFVESSIVPALDHAGPIDNSFGAGGNFNNLQSLVFDCYQAVTLTSVKVYANGAGNRTIELRNSSGAVLQSAVVNIPDGESRITLNFSLPVASDLQLGAAAAPDLFRNNAGPAYPYELPGVLSITSSTAGPDYYYFFYDWEIQRSGCATARTEVVATINPFPTVSVSGSTSVCQGDSVQITASGTDADAYSWSPGGETTEVITVSPTSQTTYAATVSNGCGTATDQITVDVSLLPDVSASLDEDICLGDSIQLSASGTGTLEWQPGGETSADIVVTPFNSTNYAVTATNSCGTASDSVLITVHALPVADAGPDQQICAGDTVVLTASGGQDYLWDEGQTADSISVSPPSTQTYSVEVTDSLNCSASSTVTVEVNPSPVQPQISLNGQTLETDAAAGYQWYLNGQQIAVATDQTYLPIESGDYTVEITDGNGCTAISGPYQWITVGMDDQNADIFILPNPFQDILRVRARGEIQQIRAFDAQGRLMAEYATRQLSTAIETTTWANGPYYLQVFTQEGMSTFRAVKIGNGE